MTGVLPGIRHGGSLEWAEARFGTPPGPWIDLSTGINPHPYPLPDLPANLYHRLPEPGALVALNRTAAARYGAPDTAVIAAAPGSQALIQWLARLTPPTSVAIVEPTYGEHARAWTAAGHRVFAIPDPAPEAPIVILGNPNNPDGRRHDRGALLALADACAARAGCLIIDEAFADVAPELSLADAAGRAGLVILRSFGKMYGLGGVRLGFCLGPADFIARLGEAIGPWPIAGPTLAIATAALADGAWLAATRERLAEEAARLDGLLEAAGFRIIGGTSLFRLAESAEAPRVHEALGKAGILVRGFDGSPERLRFGPPPATGWPRVEAELHRWRASRPDPLSRPLEPSSGGAAIGGERRDG